MRIIKLTFLVIFFAYPVIAEQGVGAILKTDCISYTSSKADKAEFELRAGTFIAFWKNMTWGDYKSENGYIRITILENNDSGIEKFTWVPEDNIELFQFQCTDAPSIGFSARSKQCLPVQVKGFAKQWTLEFKFAAKNKCKELGIEPAKIAIISYKKPAPQSSQTPASPSSTTPDNK